MTNDGETVKAGSIRSVNQAKSMTKVELVLTGPEPNARWEPLTQLPAERRAELEEWDRGEEARQALRDEEKARNTPEVVLENVPLWAAFGRAAQLAVRQVVLCKTFDNIVLVLIVASCVLMAADSPMYDPYSSRAAVLFSCEVVIVVFFSVEMAARIIALARRPVGHAGLHYSEFSFATAAAMPGIWEPWGYFYTETGGTNYWNMIDFVITSSSIISLILPTGGVWLAALRPFRVLRALRPLRLLNKQPHMRVVVSAIVTSLGAVGPLMLILLVFFLSFAIVATRYLKGRFFACFGPEFDALPDYQKHLVTYPVPYADLAAEQQAWASGEYTTNNSEAVCIWLGAKWRHILPYHFDNVFYGMATLLMICTTEAYVLVMSAAIDAREIGMQPIRNYNPQWAGFFLAIIVFGSFFLMRLFVAVVIQHYRLTTDKDEACHGKDGLTKASTDEELKWVHMQEMLLTYATVEEAKLKPPSWVFVVNRVCFEIAYGVGGAILDKIIYFCIIANTILMASRHFGQPPEFGAFVVVCQEAFAIIFMLEVIVKLIAIGPQYFKDNWNNFDFIVGTGGFIAVVAKHVNGVDGGTFISLLRVLRLGRIVRLLKHNKQLRELMGTILLALPPLGSLTAVLILFYFMYAVMGVQLFSKVRLYYQMGGHLNEAGNFQSFFNAVVSLLPAKKNAIMHELANWEDNPCSPDPQYDTNVCGFYVNGRALVQDIDDCIPIDGCGSWLAYPYCQSFYYFMTFIILNLFTAVIIKEYENASEHMESIKASKSEVAGGSSAEDDEQAQLSKPDKVKLKTHPFESLTSCSVPSHRLV
jgi:hypothetical protein